MTYRTLAWIPLQDQTLFLNRLVSVGVNLTPQIVKQLDPDVIDGVEYTRFVVTRLTGPQQRLVFENGPIGWSHTSSPNDSNDELLDDIHKFLNPTSAG